MVGALLSVFLTTARAADWPNGPVRIVIPFPPGGAADQTGRLLAEALSKSFAQQFIIDNRGGADTQIGTELVVHAKADGQTLLYTAAPLIIGAAIYSKLPYDPIRDLEPVARVVENGMLLVAHPGAAGSVQQLLEQARSQPGALTFATAGRTGVSYMACELFASLTGVQVTPVPYKGTGQIMPDLLGGQVNYFFDNPSTSIPHVRSGRLRPLGYTGARRLPALPDVPTLSESGVPRYEAVNWYGLFAPVGTPGVIVDRLHDESARIMSRPESIERVERDGLITVSGSRTDFAASLRSELAKWSKVVAERHITPE